MEQKTLYSQLEQITLDQSNNVQNLVSQVGGFPIIVTEEPGYAFNVNRSKFLPFSTFLDSDYETDFSIKNVIELNSNLDKMGSSIPLNLPDMYIQNVTTNPELISKIPLEEAIIYFRDGLNFERKVDLMLDQQKDTIVGLLNLLQFRRYHEQDKLRDDLEFSLPFDVMEVLSTEPVLTGIPQLKQVGKNNQDPIKSARNFESFMRKNGLELELTHIDYGKLESEIKTKISDHVINYLIDFIPENAFDQLRERATIAYKCRLLDLINNNGDVERDYGQIIDNLNDSYLREINQLKQEKEQITQSSVIYRQEREQNDLRVTTELSNYQDNLSNYQQLISKSIKEDEERPSLIKKTLLTACLVTGVIGFMGGYLSNNAEVITGSYQQRSHVQEIHSSEIQLFTPEEIQTNLNKYQQDLNTISTDLITNKIDGSTAIERVGNLSLDSNYNFETTDSIEKAKQMKESIYDLACKNR